MLSLLHTSCKRNNKLQENAKISNRHYHIQGIKDVQRINSKMTWKYQKFPRHPVSAETFEMRGRNTIIWHYHYSIDTKVGKIVCSIHQIPYACPASVAQLNKYWLPTIAPSYQPRYYRVGNCSYKKNSNIKMIESSWNY